VTPAGTRAEPLIFPGRAASTDDKTVGASTATRADQLIQELPFRWSVQGGIFLIGGLAYMFDAWNVLLPAYLFPLLGRSAWHLNTSELGWLGSSGLIGMALGAFLWGTLSDIIGRKRAFLWTLLNYSLFSILSALAPNFSSLLVARFITGVGLGGCIPVAYTLVAEFMPRSRRGMMLTAMDVWWPIGGTLNGLLAIVLLRYDNWRLLLLAMGIPALLVLWALSSIPESPLYLMRRGRKAEARAVVEYLVRRTGAVVGDWSLPEADPAVPSFRQFFSMFERIWSWNWRVTLMTWGLMIGSLLLYFGVLTWLPQILVSSGYGIYRAYLFTLSVTAIGIVATLLSAWLVEVVGRKWVIIVPGILASVAIVIFTMEITKPGLARWWLLLFGFFNNLFLPATWCYVPEVYPTSMRGTGFGWASTAGRLASGIVPIIFGTWLWPVLGLTNTFILVGGLFVVASLWLAAVGPETKGTSLQ
jgi:putative MFS transporter